MKKTRLRLLAVGLLVLILALITYKFTTSGKKPDAAATPILNTAKGNVHAPEGLGRASSPIQSPSATQNSPAAPDKRLISKDVALSSLRKWVEKRDGKSISILDSQMVKSSDGIPTSLNVLVTTKDGLSPEQIKGELQGLSLKEQALRQELKTASQNKDIAGVNRLVADLTEARSQFVATNGITSYKVSLSMERPPILSYWPGLPFERVREGVSLDLAVTKLGPDTSFKELAYFNSQTSLLYFTNTLGQGMFVDAINVAEIFPQTLTASKHQRRSDDGRDARIATQWEAFLKP